MEDRNKTVAELIADLQNQLNKANNRIEGLVKENDELKERNNTQFKNLHDIRLEYNGLYNKFHALDIDHAALISKYCDYNKAAQDAWNENNKIKKEIKKLKNENEYLERENTKWHSKYTKEKTKHDKATKKIDELRKMLMIIVLRYDKEKKKHQRATEKITHLKEEYNAPKYLAMITEREKEKNKE